MSSRRDTGLPEFRRLSSAASAARWLSTEASALLRLWAPPVVITSRNSRIITVSLPLCRGEGSLTPWRAFLRGCLSGIVEPIAGLLTVFFLCEADAVMPWLLSFAAGAMLYVVAEELIPSANAMHDGDRVSFIGTLSTVAGFLLMMILDVALG